MTATVSADTVRAYWMPGCSSCLRMKEFLESSGVAYEEINVVEDPSGLEVLKAHNVFVPAVVKGDIAVAGLDLVRIAELIGAEYAPPPMLPPATLRARHARVIDALTTMIGQVSDADLAWQLPDRPRTLGQLSGHAGTIMRTFLDAHDTGKLLYTWARPPREMFTTREIIDWALETQDLFERWWSDYGFDDPFDGIINTHWGHRTLHEVLERSTWHPAQHTRQVAYFLEYFGVDPVGKLQAEDLAGLPLPERVHA